MGKEIDLLKNYPKAKRNLEQRLDQKSEYDREIARRFGQEFFDGDRKQGYGGFKYNPRFWKPVIPTFVDYWGLTSDSKVLDVGCAKGFMLHDLSEAIPGIELKGVDISDYAIENCIDSMKSNVEVANAKSLPFDDDSFDVVVSINTIHNLEQKECAEALREIERVASKSSFVTVDAYRNQYEKDRMYAWNLTAKTIMSVKDWIEFFNDVGYTGDYHWFIP